MDNYEQQQYQKIAEWKNQAPSVVSRTVGKLLKPITWVVNKVIPPKAIEGVLVACNGMAEIITDVMILLGMLKFLRFQIYKLKTCICRTSLLMRFTTGLSELLLPRG